MPAAEQSTCRWHFRDAKARDPGAGEGFPASCSGSLRSHPLDFILGVGYWVLASAKGVLWWKGISDFHALCRGYGTQVAKTPPPLVEVKTSASLEISEVPQFEGL